jgi:hypothetical protein
MTSHVCAQPTPVNVGGFCANPGSQCQGSYCSVQSGGSAQCQPLAQAGQACSAAVPCVSGQRCLNSVCQPAVAGGQPCATSSDCGSDDPYCDPYAGNICTLGLTFATGAVDCNGFLLGQTPPSGGGGGSDGGTDAPAGD